MKIKVIIAAAFTFATIFSFAALAQGSVFDSPIHICSHLDFDGIQWPKSIDDREKDALALALNISGSFEGETGWVNLTNDFDGQGVSLGLLNQCLGQGSLQPLLIELEETDPVGLQTFLPETERASLEEMLKDWKSRAFADLDVNLSQYGFSSLDDEALIEPMTGKDPIEFDKKKMSRNAESVAWAKKTLYVDGRIVFNPIWYAGLSILAGSAPYRSIQLEKALWLHQSALKLVRHFGFKQLRSYLFFFDIMVQNGGINDNILSSIDKSFSKKKGLDEIKKLTFILNTRLRFVKSRFRGDVGSRKRAIINGTGKVHGAYRDFNREYCTDLGATVFTGTPDGMS